MFYGMFLDSRCEMSLIAILHIQDVGFCNRYCHFYILYLDETNTLCIILYLSVVNVQKLRIVCFCNQRDNSQVVTGRWRKSRKLPSLFWKALWALILLSIINCYYIYVNVSRVSPLICDVINQWVSRLEGKSREGIARTHYSSPPITCMVLQVPGQYAAL